MAGELSVKKLKSQVKAGGNALRAVLRAVFGDLGGEEHDTFPLRPEVLGVDRFVDLTNWVEARLKNGETTNP